MPHYLQQPIKKENEWEIDVPGDNSCLFWAATCAYLIPVIHTPTDFQQRYLQLFGEESIEFLTAIQTLFSQYNPFTNTQLFGNTELKDLVKEKFRARVIEHIASHKESFAAFWTTTTSTFDDYLASMYDPASWGGDIEIRAISQLLNCHIQLTSHTGYNQSFGEDNLVTLTLTHISADNDATSRDGNHYHFDIEKSLGDTYHAVTPTLTSPILSTATLTTPLPVDQKAMEKEEQARKELKIQEDKVNDIKSFFSLYNTLDAFLTEKKGSPQVSSEETAHIMMTIAEHFSFPKLTWNNQSTRHIRNMYGKKNYAKPGKANIEYIDFERLSLLRSFPDSTAATQIRDVLSLHSELFLSEVSVLCDNLLFILHKEIKASPHVTKACEDIAQQLVEYPTPPKKYTLLDNLISIIDIHYDPVCLARICDPQPLQTLSAMNREESPLKWRYAFARILTMLGEAAKNFSDTFKERYSFLPLRVLLKLRDQLGHVHHQHIAKENPETLALALLIVTEDIPSLQKVLDIIAPTLPTLRDAQAILKVLEESRKPLKAITLPDATLASSSLSVTDRHLLQSRRIAEIQRQQENLTTQYNKALQSVTASSSQTNLPVDNTDKNAKKENASRETIAALENRTDLTSTEQAMLKSAQKTLASLERAKQQPPSSQPVIKKTLDPMPIKAELDALEQELQTIRVSPHFYSLLDHFTAPPKIPASGKKTSTTSKLNGRVNSLEKEIQLLGHPTATPLVGPRDYAKEHSIAVIGQIMRELQDEKHLILTQVLQQNTTVQHAFGSNIGARNQKVMHDPFSDNTLALNSVILNDTLPLLPDVSALKLILHPKSLKEIESNAVTAILTTYTDLAYAFLRLNLLSEAEKYFQLALDYTTPEHFAKLHMQEAGFTPSDEAIVSSVVTGSGYVVQQGNTVFITAIDLQWARHHVQALVSLAQCQMKQNRPDLAIPHLQEASTHTEFMTYDSRYWSVIQSNLYIALSQNGGQLSNLPDLDRLMQSDYDQYANTLIHYAHNKSISTQYFKGIEALNEIDPGKITSKKVLIHFYQYMGFLAAGQARIYAERSVAHGGLVVDEQSKELLFKLGEAAINGFRSAYCTFAMNRADLKFSEGIHIAGLEENLILSFAREIGSQAAVYLAYSEHQDRAYQLIHKALTLQKKYRHDTSASYLTLGAICEKMYEKTKDMRYFEEGLDAYTQNTQHLDVQVRAIAYADKASILFKLLRIEEAVKNSINSLFCYSQMAENEENSWDKSDIKYLTAEIKKAVQTKSGIYKQVLNEYVEAGDEYQANHKPIEAEACYQKCLLGLQYIDDVPLKNRIEAKLACISENVAPSLSGIATNPFSHLSIHQVPSTTSIGSIAPL